MPRPTTTHHNSPRHFYIILQQPSTRPFDPHPPSALDSNPDSADCIPAPRHSSSVLSVHSSVICHPKHYLHPRQSKTAFATVQASKPSPSVRAAGGPYLNPLLLISTFCHSSERAPHVVQHGSPGMSYTLAHCKTDGHRGLTTLQEELPILEAFINIRNRLTALKKVSLRQCGLGIAVTDTFLRTAPGSSELKMSCRSTTRSSSNVCIPDPPKCRED